MVRQHEQSQWLPTRASCRLPTATQSVCVLMCALILHADGNSYAADEIVCEGVYDGHLQGIAIDDQSIYWSHTVQLVKTDLNGRVTHRVDVPNHHGDLTLYDGRLYVAVELGEFNQPAGKSKPWVYVYDTSDLKLLDKHSVPELVHGSGGIAYGDGRFIVVGGLPADRQVNYAFEYDKSFRFVRRHVLPSGQTKLGIQTAAFFDDHWWFGCYGSPANPGVLKVDRDFKLVGQAKTNYSYGIDRLHDQSVVRGECFAGSRRGKLKTIHHAPKVIPTVEGVPIIESSWDDLRENVNSLDDWRKHRQVLQRRFLELIRDQHKPTRPPLDVRTHNSAVVDNTYTRRLISYEVEKDERAFAYVGVPLKKDGKLPAIVALHGTFSEGMRRVAGLIDNPDKAYLDHLCRRGYVVIAPGHFVSGERTPTEGAYDTQRFYQKHPDWTAVGKFTYEHSIAIDVLESLPEVDKKSIGALGHSLGGHGTLFLAAYDDRIRAATCNCGGAFFRHNPKAEAWARDHWYIYFKHLRSQIVAGELPPIDFHEIMALVAPRPFLDVSALNDGFSATQRQRVLMLLKVAEVYELEKAADNFSFYVHGRGHSVAHDSRQLIYAWMDTHLKPKAATTSQLVDKTRVVPDAHPEAIANEHPPGEVDNPKLVPFVVSDPNSLDGIVVDETEATLVGKWQYSTHTPPYVGIGYLHDLKQGKGSSSVTFTPLLPQAGKYEVRLSHCYNIRRSTNTPVTIHHSDGDTTLRINQQETPEHNQLFRTLGVFRFEAGNRGWVRISTEDTEGKYVIADSVQFIPVN